MAEKDLSTDEEVGNDSPPQKFPVKWYRSTFYNALILGMCNFLAPGIWGAMNSLGGGGAAEPYVVNTANALTFCLMVLSCFFGSVVVRFIGIKWTLIIGTMGYAPYAAGIYTQVRYDSNWLTLFGAALCGLSAGIFWMAESAIALAYPEPENQGKFLGFWLSFRVGGQIVGGAINLGVNINRATAGSVSYVVYYIFITLQALGPFCGLLLTPPSKVQRTDGVPVKLAIVHDTWYEIKAMARLLVSRNFLLITPLIWQATFAEAVFFTYNSMWFSVRARALGSFISGIMAIIAGNLLGAFLDSKIALKLRSRAGFAVILALQGGWWLWGTIIVTDFHSRETSPVFDWEDKGFGRGFPLYLFWVVGFQLNYMFLYFIVGNLARDEEEVVRFASLLRGMESASQAVSYGLSSVSIMASVGSIYMNFGLWALALYPAWLVIREIGVSLGDKKVERERERVAAGVEN
ncbi:major facilitator superfamily domain-containing protein [Aspergillus keveii]|uniref:Major facilitator superfamily domain-containing protein n=1 Tax=Aspergillus keveii TaxID=714993 RepID=A0ABR4FMH5_9EURO